MKPPDVFVSSPILETTVVATGPSALVPIRRFTRASRGRQQYNIAISTSTTASCLVTEIDEKRVDQSSLPPQQ